MHRVRTVAQHDPASPVATGAVGLGLLLALVAAVIWSGSFVATRGTTGAGP
ncbi:hypothetical protein ABZZ20_11070 [Streptomyces sp. NPDC006430]|uniref:hypothetical protein n=1 Tax=Streptomyces sp. NPDC006430 TaxID=3154299 RepID=UPI0033BB4C6B